MCTELTAVEKIETEERAVRHIHCMGWADETEHEYKPAEYIGCWVDASGDCDSMEEAIDFGVEQSNVTAPNKADCTFVERGTYTIVVHDRLFDTQVDVYRDSDGNYWAECVTE